jgi:hypothetical protein
MFILLLSMKNNTKTILLHNKKNVKNYTHKYVCTPKTVKIVIREK